MEKNIANKATYASTSVLIWYLQRVLGSVFIGTTTHKTDVVKCKTDEALSTFSWPVNNQVD